MVWHDDNDMSRGVIGQVLTTCAWHKARELAIARFIRDELYGGRKMPRDTRPRRNIAIGGRLELARTALGMPQGKFAEAAGIRPNTYSMWEIGENFPGVDNVMKLCLAHPGLTLDWVYLGKLDGMNHKIANAITALQVAQSADLDEPPVRLASRAKVVPVPERRHRAR
jgi:transcriptional regulator with XRE-family HTH domain